MSAPRTLSQTRLAGIVLAVLLVAVAAVAYRLSDPGSSEYASSDLVRAPLDRDVSYQSGQVRVSDVRVGSDVTLGDDVFTTQGLFLVVTVRLQASGRDQVDVTSSRLLDDDGTTYLPAFSLGSSIKAEPGFGTTKDLVYEVDPARIDGLTLELWNQGLTYRYFDRTQTPLGITAANADRWRAAGAGRTVAAVRDEQTAALS